MRKLAFSTPPEAERIIGFTIPQAGAFYICDHDEVWHATLDPSPTTVLTDHAPYAFVDGRTDFLGLVFKGLPTNTPLLRVGQSEIAFDVKPKNDFVIVDYLAAGARGQIRFTTFSGDWFAASLSDDGRYLVMADPYDLAVYAVS
jgi:hypothetical protein